MPEILDQDILRVVETALGTSLEGWSLEMCSPARLPLWDSLAHLNIIALLEEKYAVSFDPEDIEATLDGAVAFKTVTLGKIGGNKA